jgi:glutamate N-acetyltransferase/amino-acid N-acetyltransferase
MKIIEGKTVSCVKGYKAAGCAVGLKKSGKKDMGLIYSELPAVSAAVFTTNVVKAAPVLTDMKHVQNKTTRAMIINSGNANACTGEQGMADAMATAEKTAGLLGIAPEEVLVYSTGVIGQPMPMDIILAGVETCAAALADGGDDVHKAIMTTDVKEKCIFVEIELSGKTVSICGIAKGSGMIHPNMATMLSYVVTDAAVSKEVLTSMQKKITHTTFNMVTVDGDTSTNDTATIIANGCAGNPLIKKEEGEDYSKLYDAVYYVTEYLAKAIAADGEGATRLMEVDLIGAESEQQARTCARSVASSSLVKAAIHGADANWGRVLCAMGYSGADFDQMKVDVAFASEKGSIDVFIHGVPQDFDEERALEILQNDVVQIKINMNSGSHAVKAWGCDLSKEYVEINGSYRS